jgi:TPR repeat protein
MGRCVVKHMVTAIILSLCVCSPLTAAPDEDDPFLAIVDLADGQAAYESGDYITALKLFRPLAEHPPSGSDVGSQAQLYLGRLYFYGDGVAQDDTEAAKMVSAFSSERQFVCCGNSWLHV